MTVRYSELGMDKRLRDIVFAGSHDAGITSGGANAQTQNLDIAGQAQAGVRLFDLRIMASGTFGKTELKAYHAGGGVMKHGHNRVQKETGHSQKVTVSTLTVGNFGLGLAGMLQDARRFVSTSSSEFLIFKFDKCTNWGLIAQLCIDVLGDRIYTGTGDLNRKTLNELKGRVIVLFSDSGLQEVRSDFPAGSGILGFRNLYAKGGAPRSYDSKYDGMQYFGKGGTSVNPVSMKWSHSGKIAENVKKQRQLMSLMANSMTPHSSDVLGMIYWTSTGIMEDIRKRNDKMWTSNGKDALRKLWLGGLKESIEARVAAKRIKSTSYTSGTQLKAFMPNIVMVDFADSTKCRAIFKLNKLAATELTAMFREDEEEEALV